MIRVKRSKRMRSEKSSTPQIIIRLLGRSIRNHAVSTAEIFSRLGTLIAECVRVGRGEAGSKRRGAGAREEIACAFCFALK